MNVMTDIKEASVRVFEEVWNNQNLAAIDQLMAPRAGENRSSSHLSP
jgi:hypothetical protein